MVKKIRVIEEAPTAEPATDNDLMELAKTMDWKLQEILQSVKRLEEQMNNKMDKGV